VHARRSNLEAYEHLKAAREMANLSSDDLWWRYFALGGTASPHQAAAMLLGESPIPWQQYDVLAQALNEEFIGLGMDHPVLYREDLAEG